MSQTELRPPKKYLKAGQFRGVDHIAQIGKQRPLLAWVKSSGAWTKMSPGGGNFAQV